MKKKIIIDTDIGDDIDDSFALQYALNHPQIDLIGVTTVYKNAQQRANMAKTLLIENGRGDINVYVGSDDPLQGQPVPFCYERQVAGKTYLLSFQEYMSKNRPSPKPAEDYLIEAAEKNPGEITLVCIAPLTNIAKAIQKNSRAMRQYEKLILMNGNLNGYHEWNVMCDPEATKIVYESGLPIESVGSDLTEQCWFTQKDLLFILGLQTAGFHFINTMMKDWILYNMRPPIIHDVLALSAAVEQYIIFKPYSVVTPLHGGGRGGIRATEDNDSKTKFGVSFDKETFMQHFREIMSAKECVNVQ